ncbi:hypothetical protein J6590_000324 [Homalodisca vitripennis]|nr:hypothetical protein J6590_000324 [Homalodisca vitripennis]
MILNLKADRSLCVASRASGSQSSAREREQEDAADVSLKVDRCQQLSLGPLSCRQIDGF